MYNAESYGKTIGFGLFYIMAGMHMKKIAFSGVITIFICITLLMLTAFIPRKSIQKNMEKSAEYFSSHPLFDHVTANAFLSRQDNYADCILTNIIYCIDNNNLVKSLVSASYYNPVDEPVNDSFFYVVNNDVSPNVEYSRYWHGSMVLLRPMYIFADIVQIRIIIGIIILILTLIFEILLFRNGLKTFGICYIISLLAMSAWMSAICIEYAMPFLILSVELVAFEVAINRGANKEMALLMTLLCSAIVTAFMDFLTTETITFTVVYCLFIISKAKSNELKELKEEFRFFIQSGVVWTIGYSAMYALKWLISIVVLGKDSFMESIQMVALRINGAATLGNEQGAMVVSNWERISGALWRNIGCIFPFRDELSLRGTLVAFAICAFIVFSLWYVFRNEKNHNICICLLWVSLIPYIRFLMINNHSYIHFFFTYRAQLVVVVAVLYMAVINVKGMFGRKK